MGTWSEEIFGNDLAADVRLEYRERSAAGEASSTVVKNVRKAFAEEMRAADDRRTVWIALAAAMDEMGAVDDAVREQALKAIAWCEAPDRDPERFPFGIAALAKLRERLGGTPPAPKKPPKPKAPPGVGGEVFAVTLPDDGGEAVIYVVGPAGNDRGDDTARIVLLFDVSSDGLTEAAVSAALSAWRHYVQDWGDGKSGRSIGRYDVSGKLPARRTRLLLKNILMPPGFRQRMVGYGKIVRSSDLPWVLLNDISDWKRCDWKVVRAADEDDDT